MVSFIPILTLIIVCSGFYISHSVCHSFVGAKIVLHGCLILMISFATAIKAPLVLDDLSTAGMG